ncbi:SRPBCC family protein [Niveibacterium umoris]|uniref:Uncharacterized protein YndB with AHSA1/START domain n=1 Tax=Niveibacterium umoris TaxID=1193620 RepID=A0A840BNG8_9RHOO|nr:SRPBCC family protein [Niveibacterium umoris]MBB4014845.1 uncharacterized protein YndB with AHSA1/START domain [Niveibacterium umoris]
MRILIRLMAGLALVAVLLVCVGWFLPARYAVSRTVMFASPPEKIWPLIESPREWARWTVWNQRDPAMKMRYSGAERGAGAAWAWESHSEGNGRMTFTAADAPRRLAYRLEFPDFEGGTNTGELLLVPDGKGTRVTWSMQGEMGGNPILRWFGLLMDRMVGPDFDGGLARLRTLADSAT